MKNLLKKYAIISLFLIWIFWWICQWKPLVLDDNWDLWELSNDFPYDDKDRLKDCDDTENKDCRTTDLWDLTSVKERESTIIVRLLWTFGLNASIEDDKDLKFIDYARAILNMTLGLIAFIALIMTIYTFYMVLFSENEAWIKKAKQNLVGIFIALGVIWLAWLIVSFIFWWYQSNWKEKEENIQTWNITEVWEFYQ